MSSGESKKHKLLGDGQISINVVFERRFFFLVQTPTSSAYSGMHQWHNENILILAKTYPTPSSKHREITCVAGVTNKGEMRRLFPLPYRYLQGDQQFQKWQWINARIRKASKDARPESFNIDSDSIQIGDVIQTKNSWRNRLCKIKHLTHSDPDTLGKCRQLSGVTLGFVHPARILELKISPSNQPDWTESEKAKLEQEFLFDSQESREKITLHKIPFDFHYVYECQCESGSHIFKHKLTDWEVGALFWNCKRSQGDNWEMPFRQKLEIEFQEKKDVYFLLGTIHRFPDQWLIVGVYYPPKPSPSTHEQLILWS